MKSNNQQTLTRKGFENMVENALKTILENADNTQYNSLHAMYERMNDVEFDNYLSKERERFLQGDVLKKYDFLKRNGLSTFEEFAFTVAHGIEESEEKPVNWIDQWKKAAWKENDFASAYMEGIRLEGMLWATNDFRNRVFNFTFEDWKNGKWPIPEQPMVGQHTYRYGNHYRVCTLSMGEYEKIVEAQKTILQKLIDLFLKGLIDEFNRRFVDSDKEKMLLESEKEKVQKWLSDKDLSGACVFPNPNGGTVIFSDLGGLARNKGEDKNLFPYWYDKILVQGNKAHAYIKPEHESEQILPYPVAVIVLDKYMIYLNNMSNVSEAVPDTIKAKDSAKKGLPAFEDVLKEPEKLPELWERLSEMERPFVNESGRFMGKKEGRNVVKILALSQAISGMIMPGYTQFDTYEMLCKLWEVPISKRPEKALDQSAYLRTLAEIKSLLK